MNFAAQVIAWINIFANGIGKFVFDPIRFLPGWLSITVISAITGIILLVVFKYTSNQQAISRVRDRIKADMISVKLFNDSLSVIFSAQMGAITGGFRLLFYAVVPMLIMMGPVVVLLAQMGLWYQARPLAAGETAVITMNLKDPAADAVIQSITGAQVLSGPVHIFSKNQVLWEIRANDNGNHRIVFNVAGSDIEKELVVGNGFMRVSPLRPGNAWLDILLYPAEKPLPEKSPAASIAIEYPKRISKTCGTDWWVGYFFIASMIFAFMFKPIIKVRI